VARLERSHLTPREAIIHHGGILAIPLKAIRRQLRRIECAARELKRIQQSIPLPSPKELEAMMAGSEPFSQEAYVLDVLQNARLSHEDGTLNVRSDLSKSNFTNPALRTKSVRRDLDLWALITAVKQDRELSRRPRTGRHIYAEPQKRSA
jgi:hypothetical protein